VMKASRTGVCRRIERYRFESHFWVQITLSVSKSFYFVNKLALIQQVLPYIAHTFNTILTTTKFEPIAKKNEPVELSDYRSISISPALLSNGFSRVFCDEISQPCFVIKYIYIFLSDCFSVKIMRSAKSTLFNFALQNTMKRLRNAKLAFPELCINIKEQQQSHMCIRVLSYNRNGETAT
jgi:hypothetical protein